MNSITIVGFVGAHPEQRQVRNDGSKFTVLSVATQRSWKNAEDEWVSKVEWHRVAIMWNLMSRQILAQVSRLSLEVEKFNLMWVFRARQRIKQRECSFGKVALHTSRRTPRLLRTRR